MDKTYKYKLINKKNKNRKYNSVYTAKLNKNILVNTNKTKYRGKAKWTQKHKSLIGGGDFEIYYTFGFGNKISPITKSELTAQTTFTYIPEDILFKFPKIKITSPNECTYEFTFSISPIVISNGVYAAFSLSQSDIFKCTITREKGIFGSKTNITINNNITPNIIKTFKSSKFYRVSVLISSKLKQQKKNTTAPLATTTSQYFMLKTTKNVI